jgi:oligopeptide/dipeptide ABC transporter ATP-binding protein
MVGGQISLEVGLAAAVLATVLGTLWGAIAGYFGGAVDAVMMRLVDALLSIPTLFLALVVVSLFPSTEGELILVIALASWLTTSRLIRGEALSLRVRVRDYVQAIRRWRTCRSRFPPASMGPRMRVSTILREPMVIQRDGSRASQSKRVAAMLNEVGLPAAATERYPHEFSGGQRQRLGLARALMLRPAMIVADEPVAALDVSIQAQILNLMLDLQRDNGLTYQFISHDLSVVRYMADVIGVMYLGKMVEVGPADAVYSAPVHPHTRGLIDTVPVADPALERAKEHQGVRGELPSAVAPTSGCRFRTRCPRAADLECMPVTGGALAGRPGARDDRQAERAADAEAAAQPDPGRGRHAAVPARARQGTGVRPRSPARPIPAEKGSLSNPLGNSRPVGEVGGAGEGEEVSRGGRGDALAEHPVIHVHAGGQPEIVGGHVPRDDDAAMPLGGAAGVLRGHPERVARRAGDDRTEIDELTPLEVIPEPTVVQRAHRERGPVQRVAADHRQRPDLRSRGPRAVRLPVVHRERDHRLPIADPAEQHPVARDRHSLGDHPVHGHGHRLNRPDFLVRAHA